MFWFFSWRLFSSNQRAQWNYKTEKKKKKPRRHFHVYFACIKIYNKALWDRLCSSCRHSRCVIGLIWIGEKSWNHSRHNLGAIPVNSIYFGLCMWVWLSLGRFGRIFGTSVLDFYLCYTSGNLKHLDLYYEIHFSFTSGYIEQDHTLPLSLHFSSYQCRWEGKATLQLFISIVPKWHLCSKNKTKQKRKKNPAKYFLLS